MKTYWNRLAMMWCRFLHSAPLWPAHGYYVCSVCQQVYPVPWREGEEFSSRLSSSGHRDMLGERYAVFEFQKNRI